MKAFWSPIQQAHAPRFFLQRGIVRANLETPDRAEALLTTAARLGLDITAPPPLEPRVLGTVHEPAYLAFLAEAHAAWDRLPDHGPELVANVHPTREMITEGGCASDAIVARLGWFTTDTACPIGADTWAAACAAAACAVAAADEAASGRNAYALTRPPGHHAYPARAGGHCYLNNAALAAARLRACGAARVAVLDIDAHHGNGTQSTFWVRDDVLTVSVHGDPGGYYPWFVGRAGERGAGAGIGCNLNLPLARGAEDAAWLAAIATAIDAIRDFGARALVLSLGFDASIHEPLGFLRVSDDGFARAGEAVGALGLPTAIVQEGGYAVDALGRLLTRFLGGFAA